MGKRKSKYDKDNSPLTIREEAFVNEYMVDENGTRAAKAAGYNKAGAHVMATRLLHRNKIQAALRQRRDQRMKRCEISQDRTIQEIAMGCFWDPADLFNTDGSLKQIRDMSFNTRRCVAGFEVVELYEGEGEQKHAFGRLNKIKLVDRRDYLELLGRHQGLFKDELMVKHEFSAELTRIVAGGLDLSKFTDEQLEEFNANIARLVAGRGDQRALPPQSIEVVATPHEDSGRPLEGEGIGPVHKIPE
ncbi:MAG TPA: terminase small subunit [Terriglobia bacterium]|nr:terminase small subunit [Terriglobia bacterium]